VADLTSTTAQLDAIEADLKARREAKAAATTTPEETPTVTASTDTTETPTPKDVAQATGAVSTREAGTVVLIDGLPAFLVAPVELIQLDGGGSLDVWCVERFTPTGPELIERHGFLDSVVS